MDAREGPLRPRDWAREALLAMSRRSIPPTPENYLVWYTIVSDANATLSRVVALLDARGAAYDAERCRELHQRFFGDAAERTALESLGECLEHRLVEVAALLTTVRDGARSYDAKLGGVDARLATDLSARDLTDLLGWLRTDTRSFRDETSRWEEHTRTHAEQVQQLRNDLVAARNEAETDPLTRLGNRKRFERRLRELARASLDGGLPLSLLFSDIDHFKSFNDSYGHSLGDRVLGLVASKLKDVAGNGVEVFRYGGEEFASLVLGADLAQAVDVAEAIRRGVASSRITRRSDGVALRRITLSIGLSQYEPGEPLGRLVERSDAALYAAKNAGRNRTSIKRARKRTTVAA